MSDIRKVLIDEAEAEAYDRIKTIPKGERIRAFGVAYQWFTDVSGPGLAKQAKRPTHPDPPKR